ncbi:exocyst complex component [Trichoderma longibrachiatum ATCC 18648]|uniref:Exocyst complex component Sec8 n=1 Tax=Trichoderma longibrachiatum ATCC 18648 TaxID=983965 RepID=A0A2T4CAM6_TRILO|nr:exocyst complex component [Trichoderma longibrachiatum ATCC 18648]
MSNGYGSSKRGGDGYGNFGRSADDYDPYGDSNYRGDRYNAPAAAPQSLRNMPSRPRVQETSAERQIAQVLDHIKSEWPSMCREDCVPVQLALQLLDNSSVGRAHDYRKFQTTHKYLQESLKNIVHEHHQGFNSSIGTFHKIQSSIQVSQKRVRALKESLAQAKTSLCATDPGLKILSEESKEYDELLQTLNELDDLRAVPDQLEARISEKRFLTAVDVLQTALRKLRKPELDNIGALSDLRSYLANQETVLMDILVEELHEHLYLKSPYCQQRWSSLAKNRGGLNESNHNGANPPVTPFYLILDSMDFERPVLEDPMKNPEADTFYYVTLLVEALNKLGRLQNAVETLKQRLPVELFGVVNETINEVEQRHPTSFRSAVGKLDGVQIYSARELQMRADVIYDLLWTLYGKFEAIGEGQRVFHESIKALIRREGSGNNIALLGSFKELWHLYQNEIRSLLHNYVTTDADVYQFDSPTPGAGAGGKDGMREHLFKFSETDTKSTEVTAEFDALESIIQATVPGLTSGSRKQGSENKRTRSTADELGSRRSAGYGVNRQAQGSYKSLVEPSVFNMSLLLPPTLIFLQRLKTIVPPGSDLATSTLTTFLDNFLVNVFQPQLDETLGKLCDAVFGEADTFLQDPAWNQCSQRPIFKGATAFFQVVTAFCRMLGTIPPDQALSSLIVTQMMRYYDRCFSWFQSLVTKRHDQPADTTNLRASARFSVQSSEVNEVAQKLWASEELDSALMRREVQLLIQKTNSQRLEANDVIQDRDTISALCLLYTSMRWLAAKIEGLKYITAHDTDSSRQHLPRQSSQRWTLNDLSKTSGQNSVQLPLTVETAQTFDTIVSSFEELAATALLTLHMEVRCRIIYSLRNTLSPDSAPYVLEQDVREPDPQIISLNQELVSLDETIVEYLREKEIVFIRTGLGILINNFLVQNACLASPMNDKGCHRMQLNILVLQQNLKNIEDGVDLAKATSYFQLFERGPDAIVEKAREYKDRHGMGTLAIDLNSFTYDELRALVELCYSEQLANPERGITAAARRQMDNKFAKLSEFKWE